MTNAPTNDSMRYPNMRTFAQQDLPLPLALLLFTQRLSALKAANVGMTRALDILHDSPAPYGAISEDLKKAIEQGDLECQAMSPAEREENRETWWYPRSLHQAMSRHPDHFSTNYVTLVRAGEIGGALDETLRRLHSGLAREWKLPADHPGEDQYMLLSRPGSVPRYHDWLDLSVYQKMVTLALFFETFGMLLMSGVALLPAMDAVSALLPASQSVEFMQIRKEIKEGAPLVALPVERLNFIPRYAKEIAGIGQMRGFLDRALHEAGLLFEQELDYRLM